MRYNFLYIYMHMPAMNLKMQFNFKIRFCFEFLDRDHDVYFMSLSTLSLLSFPNDTYNMDTLSFSLRIKNTLSTTWSRYQRMLMAIVGVRQCPLNSHAFFSKYLLSGHILFIHFRNFSFFLFLNKWKCQYTAQECIPSYTQFDRCNASRIFIRPISMELKLINWSFFFLARTLQLSESAIVLFKKWQCNFFDRIASVSLTFCFTFIRCERFNRAIW